MVLERTQRQGILGRNGLRCAFFGGLVGVLVGLPFFSARAAQDAIVSTETASVRERPIDDAKVIETFPYGQKIRISSRSKDGWFKTRARTGQLGWVSQNDITLLDFKDELGSGQVVVKGAPGRERRDYEREPTYYLSFGGLGTTIEMLDFNQAIGLSSGHMSIATGFWADFSLVFMDRFRAGVRYMSYSSTLSVAYLGNTYQVTNSGNPIMVGIEGEIARSGSFNVEAAGYVGYSPSTTITVNATTVTTASAAASPASLSTQSTIRNGEPAYLVNFTGMWHLAKWAALMAGAGVYYCKILKTALPAFQGQVPNGTAGFALDNADAQHFGPLITLGAQFRY